MSSAIQLLGLTKKFGSQTAVKELTFDVPAGEIFGFLGPNGSGKTTTIKMLCGLMQPTSGTAIVNAFDVLEKPDRVRLSIGYMSQQFSLYRTLTVIQNLDFYAELYGLSTEKSRLRKEEVIAITGLQPYRHRQASQLSGGWKQRLALACAIVHEPPIVFLDEPTAGIDPVARRALWDLLFTLASISGITFFVTTHYMDEAERCSSLGYIYHSQLIAYGKTDSLRSLPSVNDASKHHLEVTCSKIMPTFQHFKNRADISDVTIFGRSLHVVAPVALSAEILMSQLKQTDLDVLEIRLIKPSLEDVFVALTEQEDKRRISATKAEVPA